MFWNTLASATGTGHRKKVDTECMHALSRAGQPARILRFQIDCLDAAASPLGLRNFLLVRVSGEVARRRLRHSVLLFFMTPARLWREMGRRLGRHVDKANNGYGGEGPRGCC